MIIKTLSRKSNSDQLIRYVFRYIFNEEKQERNQEPFIIKHNIRSKDLPGFIKEFKKNESHRIHTRKDQVVLNHTILSWAGKDREKITPQMLKDIAKRYIQLRGEGSLYLGTLHSDRQHLHLHLVMSGVKLNGHSNRISQKEFAELKLALDNYQREKYPELSHSLPEHGRSKAVQRKDPTIDRRNGRVSQKEQLLHAIQTAHTNAKSQKDFLQTLQSLGHEPYYRAGQLTGIKLETGRKFRFRSLGFDTEKLAELTTRQINEAKELADLQAIRLRSSERGQEREVANDMKPGDGLCRMEEFDSLRISSRGVRGYIPAR